MSSDKTIVTNTIILSAYLFGSFYLFSTSLTGLNKKWLKRESVSLTDIINGSIMVVSGTAITTFAYKAIVNKLV